MKQIVIAISVIVITISCISVAFTINQVNREKERLTTDLQYRSTLLAESFKETIEPNFVNETNQYLQNTIERFANRERLAGLVLYDNKDTVIAMSPSLSAEVSDAQKITSNAMDEDTATGGFVTYQSSKKYLLAVPLHDQTSVVGALMIVQHADYIDNRIEEIWRNNLARLLTQVLLLSVALVFILRWLLYKPLDLLAESLRLSRTGGVNLDVNNLSDSTLFKPLTKEISNMKRSLLEARTAASEEARLSLEKLDSPWTSQRLKEFIKDILKDRKIVVVSNREPYIHTRSGNILSYYVPASGMVTAIEPIMQACESTWIAHGSGDADKEVVDVHDRIKVPPDEPKYTLKRVWLTNEQVTRYYNGFCNEGLWALCHNAHTRPIFRKEDWEEYKKVNGAFAEAVLSEIKNLERPIVLIQDFHFSLLPRMLKKSRPDAVIGLFWHIPWVSPESFSICPWKKEILDGMLGADLLGFHTQLHCNNFIDTVGRELESLIDFEQYTITRDGHASHIKSLPISIDFANGKEHKTPPTVDAGKALLKQFGITTQYLGLGVDRMDYTKGILERFKAVEIFLHKYPLYKEQFTFLQIAAPSRSLIKKYHEFAHDVEKEADRINDLFKTKNWKPIVLVKKHHTHKEINQLYRLTNFCLISSLHDGMNLVAKEFIAARTDQKGVLILSQFTGASRELKDALIINPYNGEQTADAIHTALKMPFSEQTKRMKKLQHTIQNYNVFRWSADLLRTLINIE